MSGLTRRQADCLAAIQRLTVDGVSPNLDELAAELGVSSKSQVHRLLKSLEERGAIRQIPFRSRSIVILGAAPEAAALQRLDSDALRAVIRTCARELADRGVTP